MEKSQLSIWLKLTKRENMNKARLRQEYTTSGSFIGDLCLGVAIGLNLFFCLILFLSF